MQVRLSLVAPVLLGFLVAAACSGSNTSEVSGGAAASGNTANGSGVGGSGLSLGSGGSSASGNGTGTGGSGTFDPNSACATSSANGEPIPVDLYFMVDITGSMNCPVPQDPMTPCEVDPGPPYSKTTRWTVESAALSAFVGDPMNKGLGMGIRFFPSQNNICSAATYVKPAVEIGVLPGSAMALDASIMAQTPGGNTPTVPSLDGALRHAAAWAMANPTHRVAVVYATDGYPEGCGGNNIIPAAAALAATAFKGKPSIPTYVLGVGPNLTDLNSMAMSGGTTKAFLIDTTQDAAMQLSAALASIRTTAVVGCTYAVPPPPAGQTLDPTKVNVTYTDSKGKVTTVLQDPPGTTCANGMGWEYSANNTQIDLCGSLCTSIKANPGGSLQVLFGCATQVGKPK
jgi:hypothetical protein